METEAEALNGEATDSRRMEVQIGGAVTLECDGGCWGHGPGMDPVGGPGPLVLSRVVYQEAGEYRCVAPDRKMQDTWRAQLSYHIKVTGEPFLRLIPRCGDSFPRCNVKNNAFAALNDLTTNKHVYSNVIRLNFSTEKVVIVDRSSSSDRLTREIYYVSSFFSFSSGKSSGDFHLAISLGNNNSSLSPSLRPVEYKWFLQRVASSENETSESSRDNFSTSKPVDMFDSNLSQLRRVDRPPPFFPSSQTLPTDEVANHDEIAFSTEKFCRSWQLSRRIWFTIIDGGTESCYRTTLRFETIQSSHTGEWLLLVRSSEGIADASVLLNVTRASGYSHAHIRSASITYLLLCLILQAILREYRR
ncbi:hypothetical protein ALC53_02884 [Atta colombica]|uniref:Ig-like domain-containing protein n=1 Tax=Atta colombica TaxID=520822 RepID=A0A195BR13_9HYME|nr:hypothetical protein ALC53_02884 [Atta colombica]